MAKPTKETIEKIRLAQLGRKFTDEHKEKLRLARIGRKLSPEHKAKLANILAMVRVQKGQTFEEAFGTETAERMKEKMRQAKLGRKMPWNKGHLPGKTHPRWKGGLSRAYKTGYYSIEYKAWRKAVFERDGYKCCQCGASGYVTAHHIKSFARYPKLRYILSNGATLCEACHELTDNYKGRAKLKAGGH